MALIDYKKQIIEHPYFQKLKDIVENNTYHDHESVYDHLLKSVEVAEKVIDGQFIENYEAREKFSALMGQKIHGTTLKDLMILIILMHDCGKILNFTEGDKKAPMNFERADGNTYCAAHEFWGGRLVAPKLLEKLDLSADAKKFIIEIVKIHNAFEEPYFESRKDWPFEQLMRDVKSRANGYYEEALFCIYCDCYYAKPYANAKKMIEKIFNSPSFYDKRRYLLPTV